MRWKNKRKDRKDFSLQALRLFLRFAKALTLSEGRGKN